MIWKINKAILREIDDIEKFRAEKFNKKNLRRNLVKMNQRVLVKYLSENFPKDGQDYHKYKNKIQVIESLDQKDISNAIARLDRINHVNDQKRYFFFIAPLFALITAAIVAISTKINFPADYTNLDIILDIVRWYSVPLIFHMILYKGVLMDSYDKATVNYFKDLLIEAKDEKKSSAEGS
ncbi:hypothetical protein [Bacillus pumilus]|uniref:Uncharacterized protein n=1 Tax=Bacillus pumilus TaxID=1408 RepID=A0AAD0HLX0_BACPU|nr:hypothetical protein [Bacillus pumilus]AVM23451.1 hypothetical protein C5695_06255 [Bacillus pumilus]TYS44816.1 hypothetical protein FZC68_02390 [Bacillus pumilus]